MPTRSPTTSASFAPQQKNVSASLALLSPSSALSSTCQKSPAAASSE
jgi:hypothetical protein